MSNPRAIRFRSSLARRVSSGAVAVLVVGLGALAAAPAAWAREDGGQPVTVTVPEHTLPPGQAALACTGAGGGALGNNPTLHPGDQLACTGTGFRANEQVATSLGRGRELATLTADQDGTARADISLPANLGAGRRTLTFAGRDSDRTAGFAFTVTIVANLPVGGGGGSGGGGSLPRTGFDVLGLVGAGVALVVVGVVMTTVGRRRVRLRQAAAGEARR